ncbi:senecionine N-oxygenase-like [Contarinia nasturtii]|uniref:senecionine N-oxygenase-like n=1 Tax=Contarinia nasturtii TaxID=265458 RepID=UPI0012D3ACB9|nr:senecionine N-oxygenase-like [Contarinia nasturtii]
MATLTKNRFIFLELLCGLISAHGLDIAIVGAGPSGLVSARNALKDGHKVDIYEKSEAIGGVWYYTDKTGNDSFGFPIHSPMYHGMRTNIPHQIMEFPGWKYPEGSQSYPTYEAVWSYIDSYAKKFKLMEHIKLRHLVEEIISLPNDRWQVNAKIFPAQQTQNKTYDAVFICTNLYSWPYTPHIDDADKFEGIILHSHDFRKADDFRGKEVLIIGSGESARDIGRLLSKTAKRIAISTNQRPFESDEARLQLYGANFSYKPTVKCFTPNGAAFSNGTSQTFDTVIYATGYRYKFPFLSNDTGIKVDDNFIYPLYKQVLNIEHPTMAFIGVPLFGVNNYVYDLQARFALKFLSKSKEFPSQNSMYLDTNAYVENLWKVWKVPKSKTHLIGLMNFKQYYEEFARIADIAKIPDIIQTLFHDAIMNIFQDPVGYRNYKYIIKGDKYEKEKE